MKKPLALALSASLLLISLVVGGCTSQPPSGEGFAIYLTKDDIPVSQMPVLSHVDIAATPIIAGDDIISYVRSTHEIEITGDAYTRLIQLQTPTQGKAFVVCVDKNPIYWGAFWVPFSSQSFDGVTIEIPILLSTENGYHIKITLGYPAPSFFQGEDPRSNPVIMQSLENAGKLK